VYNWRAMRLEPPDRFAALRVDSNNDCNVHCVYCHNHRSSELLAREAFLDFLHENVLEVDLFQLGCVMEPTLDPRMCDFLLDVSQSPAKPRSRLVLQTNGILLHKHSPARLRDAGLTDLSVSIDSADAGIHKALRGGTNVSKVARNVEGVRRECPDIRAEFVTTVTRANVDHLEALIAFGLDLGVSCFVLREVFYKPDNEVVDHSRMPSLVLAPGDFDTRVASLTAAFAGRATIRGTGQRELAHLDVQMTADSRRG
jgi:MoaA/NifB/PqqE/SkfB family radical SAM enzyme